MVNHPRSKSPNPIKSSPHPPMQAPPMIDIFLDPSIIPSLPPPGGRLGHHELMGRPRFFSSELPRLNLNPGDIVPPVPPKDGVAAGYPMGIDRPGLHRRSSSMELPMPGNRAGVGAGRGGPELASIPQRRSDLLEPPRPAVVRRTSSFEDRKPIAGQTVALSKPRGMGKAPRRHEKTASDSTSDTLTPSRDLQPSRSSYTIPSFLAEYDEGYIHLGSSKDLGLTSKLLLTLSALTPPHRVVSAKLPPPTSGILHPAAMLTPLAIILEALVAERSVLQSSTPSPLPLLRDGSSLQLKGGGGELDWTMMKPYILAVGTVIGQLMPYLQGSMQKKEVEGLTKGLRVYVGKQKKVFGEVASMYVEGYEFMRGWWDESRMKGCAGEIGRWGDMVDA